MKNPVCDYMGYRRRRKKGGGGSKCHVKFRGRWVTPRQRQRMKRKKK